MLLHVHLPKLTSFLLLLFSSFYSISECITQTFRYSATSELIQYPCETIDSANSNTLLIPGPTAIVLSNPTQTTHEMSIAGWIMPRGYLDQFYTIFSFHEYSTTISTLSYSPINTTIRHQFLTESPIDTHLPQFISNEWFYVILYIHYDKFDQIGTSGITISNTASGKLYQRSQQAAYTRPKDYSILNTEFNIGFHSNPLNTPQYILPSCSYTRYINIIKKKIEYSNLLTLLDNAQSMGTYLLSHFDAMYSPNNQRFIYSIDPSENALYTGTISTSSMPIFEFPLGQHFETDAINASTHIGFTIVFSFKTSTASPPNTRILSIISKLYYLHIDSSQNLKIQSQSISGIDYTKWVQVIIVVQYGLQRRIMFQVNNSSPIRSVDLPTNQPPLFRLLFGYQSNTYLFNIDTIRIFSGILIDDTLLNNCVLSIQSLSINQCLLCASSYKINLLSNYQCVTSPDSLNNPWASIAHQPCPTPSMIKDRTSNTCRCRVQQYQDINGKCQPCPKYCKPGCTSPTGACPTTSDAKRNTSTGECPLTTFDDGYYCKDLLTFIPTISSTVGTTPPVTITTTTTTTTIVLYQPNPPTYNSGSTIMNAYYEIFDSNRFSQLSGVTSSFLFTFSFLPIQQIIYIYQVIARVVYSSTEVITLVLVTPAANQLLLNMYIENIQQFSQALAPYSNTWYALFIEPTQILIYIHTSGILFSKVIPVTISVPLSNLSICIGSCSSDYFILSTPPLGAIHARPFLFLNDISFNSALSYYQQSLNDLLMLDSIFLCRFTLALILHHSNQLDKLDSSIPSGTTTTYKLDFEQSKIELTQQLKGFGFNSFDASSKLIWEGVVADVSRALEFPPSFSASIYIQEMYASMTLLSYQFTSTEFLVTYYLIPFEQSRNVGTRICVGYSECKDTTDSTQLYMQQPNFLAILTSDMTPFSSDLLKLDFTIVCNYSTERITFLLPRNIQTTSTLTQITLVEISTTTATTITSQGFLIYLNRIIFIAGNSYFYLDYSPSNNCFVSFGFTSRTCIQPKRDYALLKYTQSSQEYTTVISNDECVNDSTPTIRFVNIYTRECIDSFILKISCEELDQSLLSCLRCSQGYYTTPSINPTTGNSDGTTNCEKCDSVCTTCSQSASNCGACKDPVFQYPPDCSSCITDSYFINSLSVCQTCNPHCLSCSLTASNCITCSSQRVNPPLCTCDPSYYIENILTGECEPIICDSKCLSCIGSPSNCITCSANRFNPPQCTCFPNSDETTPGCDPCEPGEFYSSFESACMKCELPCTECTGNAYKCLECQSGFTLRNQQCDCQFSYARIHQQQISNNSLEISPSKCAKEVEITFNIRVNNNQNDKNTFNQYILEFVFPNSLKKIDFLLFDVSTLLKLSLEGVSEDLYELGNTTIEGNLFTVQVIPTESFHSKYGYVIFLIHNIFVSVNEEEVLSHIYLEKPFLIPEIGPFFFKEDVSTPLVNFNGAAATLKNSVDQTTFSAIQGIQLAFYVFGSFQPTVLFLLLAIKFPPNLYSFLQTVGITVFPNVLDYQAHLSLEQLTQQSTQFQWIRLIGLDDNAILENQSNEYLFQRIGLSNSLLISIPLISFKYIMILILVFLNGIFVQAFEGKKVTLPKSIQAFLVKQLIVENQVNFLLVGVSSLLNFENPDSDSWANRIGFYLSMLILGVNLFVIVKLSEAVRNIKFIRETDDDKKMNLDLEPSENLFQIYLLQNLKDKRKESSKTYFLCEMLFNYILIIVLVVLREFQQLVCLLCFVGFSGSAVLTIVQKPFLRRRSRNAKILIDILFSICWLTCFAIVGIEEEMTQDIDLDEGSMQSYLDLGNGVATILIILNFIYIIESSFTFIEAIQEFLKVRREKKLNKFKGENVQFDLKEKINYKSSKNNICLHFKHISEQQEGIEKRNANIKIDSYEESNLNDINNNNNNNNKSIN